MKPEIVQQFKTLFETQRKALLTSRPVVDHEIAVKAEDMADETDLSTSELEASMRMRLRNREVLFAKKIDEALERIAQGTFGECGECGDEIELRRLEARPTATHCVACKEEAERLEHVHIDGRKPKSLGFKLRLA